MQDMNPEDEAFPYKILTSERRLSRIAISEFQDHHPIAQKPRRNIKSKLPFTDLEANSRMGMAGIRKLDDIKFCTLDTFIGQVHRRRILETRNGRLLVIAIRLRHTWEGGRADIGNSAN